MTRNLTTEEAAERLQLKVGTVRRLCSERRLGHFKVGHVIRIPEPDLQAFIDSGYVPARTPERLAPVRSRAAAPNVTPIIRPPKGRKRKQAS